MTKARVSNSVPNYRQALAAMRVQAEVDVRDAITSVHRSVPKRVRQRAKRGDYLLSLFDGILTVVAEQIMVHAAEGRELEMTRILCNTLTAKIHQRTCRGRA